MKMVKKVMAVLVIVLTLFGGILIGEYASPDHIWVIIIAAIDFVALIFTLGYVLGRRKSHNKSEKQ